MKSREGMPKQITVTLRRANGRFVKEYKKDSKYAAKRLKQDLEEQYDSSYYVEIT